MKVNTMSGRWSFPQPSLVEGLGRILDFGNMLGRAETFIPPERPTTSEAFDGYLEAVGRHFNAALAEADKDGSVATDG